MKRSPSAFPRSNRTSTIPWRYWFWTHSDENLFLLDADQYDWFKRLVEGYYAANPSFFTGRDLLASHFPHAD